MLPLLLLKCNEALPVLDDALRRDGHQVADRDNSLQLPVPVVSTLPRRGPFGLALGIHVLRGVTTSLFSVSVEKCIVCKFIALEGLPSSLPVGG